MNMDSSQYLRQQQEGQSVANQTAGTIEAMNSKQKLPGNIDQSPTNLAR